MRGFLLPFGLFCAVAATVGLALLALRREKPAPESTTEAPEEDVREPAPAPREGALRPYQTTATLAEDLRDALAGDPQGLDAECWRVSRALKSKARWTLIHLAPREASPRVRALLVLAAGVHVPDDATVIEFLSDRSPTVRQAAALALGQAPGAQRVTVLGVRVSLGRVTSDETVASLRRCYAGEKNDDVKAAIRAVLEAGGHATPGG